MNLVVLSHLEPVNGAHLEPVNGAIYLIASYSLSVSAAHV